jgi:ribosome-binding factor A
MSQRLVAKVREEIKRRLSEIFEYEARDPRLRGVTVMDVGLSGDLRYATVYVSLSDLSDEKEEVKILEVLDKDRGFFRSELAKRLSLRHTPEIRFELDQTEKRAQRIEELLGRGPNPYQANTR